MNPYLTGAVIRELREKQNLTQLELAEKLQVSDKTVSKWETGKGYPDITLLEPIAAAFGVSVTELLAGKTVNNRNRSANMKRMMFYVCPVCGNVITGTGEAVLQCHGVTLLPCEPELPDNRHAITVEPVEDEYFIHIDHEMTKTHYISFVAALSSDRLQVVKLYPEGNAETRLPVRGTERILYYCNRDGLFVCDIR